MKNVGKNKKFNNKFERALKESFKEDISIDKTYKRNLDKLIDNSIRAKKIGMKEREVSKSRKSIGLFDKFFKGAKWQVSLLVSFVGMLFVGGIVFAAVPQVREVIIPTQGDLYVNSEPQGALVELKGGEYDEYISLGYTPLDKQLKKGDYEVRITLEDYDQYTSSFVLEADKTKSFEIILNKKMTALDRIKEWRTYTDLEKGYELTYPLEWKLSESDINDENDPLYQSIEIENDKSKLVLYFGDLDIENELNEFEIDNTRYTGIEDYESWKYVIAKNYISENNSNEVKILFYTRNEEDIEIYDYINSTVKVNDIDEQNGATSSWYTYIKTSSGFSFKYPSSDWIVIEIEKNEYFEMYEVKPREFEGEGLKVVYYFGYYDELNNYEFNGTDSINGMEVGEYISPVCDGKIMYAFPNRFYILFESTDDVEINEKYERIIQSFRLLNESQFYKLSDYDFGLQASVPKNWYYHSSGSDPNYGYNSLTITTGSENIVVWKWQDVSDDWEGFVEDLGLDNATISTSDIKIDGSEYVRWTVWTQIEPENYHLSRIIYLPKENGEVTIFNPVVNIGDNEYVITGVCSIINLDSIENISAYDDNRLKVLDSLVSDLKAVE